MWRAGQDTGWGRRRTSPPPRRRSPGGWAWSPCWCRAWSSMVRTRRRFTSNFCSFPRSPRNVTKSVPRDLRLTKIQRHVNKKDNKHFVLIQEIQSCMTVSMKKRSLLVTWGGKKTWSCEGTPAWCLRPFVVFDRSLQPSDLRPSSTSRPINVVIFTFCRRLPNRCYPRLTAKLNISTFAFYKLEEQRQHKFRHNVMTEKSDCYNLNSI